MADIETTAEKDAQAAALQAYFEDNTPAGYGAAFRAGWAAARQDQGYMRMLREACEAVGWLLEHWPEDDDPGPGIRTDLQRWRVAAGVT